MRISLTLELKRSKPAWSRTMPDDDLIDRLIQKRKADQSSQEVRDRLSLERSEAVSENADWLWRQITANLRHLVSRYNNAFGGSYSINPTEDDPARSTRIEVSSPAFPIGKLELWRVSAHLIQFSVERIEGSFAPRRHSEGRLNVHSDSDRNLYATCDDGTTLLTPQAVAEYLLAPIFTS